MRFQLSITVLALFAFSACGPRDPGPSESEFGETFFWRVLEEGNLSFGDECTDLASFRDVVQTPALEPNSYVIYRVAEDGSRAQSQDCDRLDTSTCTDGEFDFQIAGSNLEAQNALDTLDFEGACDAQRTLTIKLSDEGEVMKADFLVGLELVGPTASCNALENDFRTRSENGRGLEGCVVTLSFEAEFTRTLVD